MNHCYRLIWNELHRTWVAVCEFARARGKRSSNAQAPARGPRYRPLCLALALAFAPAAFAGPVAPEVNALPSGGQVTRGSASIGSAGNVMTINQASQRAAYQFKTFDIGAAASVNVNAAAGASGLFRINDNKASQIYGKFNAPGYNAFFTNPNGFYFAPGSQVNVGSLLATTLRMNEDAFMDGNFRLTDPGSGLIDALGSIEAGSVALVGNSINQGGSIVAATVSLVSGNTVAIDLTGNNLIRARIEDPSLSASITNSGDIRATTVTMSAGQARNALQSVVNNSGTVRAVGLSNQGGEIALVADFVTAGGSLDAGGTSGGTVSIQAGDTALVTGTVSAAGNAGKGGRVEVLGSHVGLLDGARIDASGSTGGGSVYAGGGLRGADAALSNAQALWFGRHASISADATATGDGGTVVLWSEAVTRAYGDLSARGGISGGDGGFVEVSSRGQLVWDGNADTRAPQGRTGTLLFDPTTIWIASDQASATAAGMVGSDSSVNASGPFTFQASGAPADSLLTISTLLSALGSNNVTVTTASPGSGAGDINVVNDLAWSANRLTLTADRDININAVMTASGTSQLDLDPGALGSVKVGFNADGGFRGRVDFPGRSGTGILTIDGLAYTVINALGAQGSTTGTDLQGMQGNLAGRYALGADINAAATVGWNSGAGFLPVSNFTGKFNGLGHTVSGLTINRATTDFVGLFGKISASGSSAEVRNVGLVGGSVTGRNLVGALVGENGGGFPWGSLVSHSFSTASVIGNNEVGGLVGRNSQYAVVTSSYATGNVSGASGVGGLVGKTSSEVSNSYASGSVSGTNDTGGLVGQMSLGPAAISNSYAIGTVAGNNRTGGLVGSQGSGNITNSYARGKVTGGGQTGGLIGEQTGGSVTSSYWDRTTSNQSSSEGGTGKFTADMQNPATFTGWDSVSIWDLTNGLYPTLRSLGGQCGFGACWDGGAGDFNWFSANNWTGNTLPTVTQSVFIKTLASPVLYGGTGSYASLKSDSSLTLQSGSLTVDGATTFASGTTFKLVAGTLNFNGATSLGNLTIEGGSAGATGAVSVAGTYSQTGGTWLQIQPTLPAFSAGQFNFNGGTFLRATGGDGSTTAPFLIADIYGLQGMASTSLLNQAFKLVDDIDASDTENWNAGKGFRPIGDVTNPFTGKFDGDGNTITGLTIDRPTEFNVGLFGITDTGAEIREVGLVGGSVTGDITIGGLAGYNRGTVTDSYATGTVSGTFYIGGLVGYNTNSGTVSHSYATGSISGDNRTGGLVGENTGTVSHSYASGSVSGNDTTGGLAGFNGGTVTNSYATGSVSGNTLTGGLVGDNSGSGTVTDSYATGSVSGNDTTGGLVGINNNGTVTNSYATGSVSGNTTTGGLIGNNSGSVTASFWNMDTSGQSASDGGTGLTNAAMKDPANFTSAGWDPAIWDFEAGLYPTLQGLGGQCGFGACWDGGAGNFNWFSADNWTGNTLPTAAQSVFIKTLASPVLYGGTGSYASLKSDSSLTLQSGSLTVDGATTFASSTTFKLEAGTLNFNGATSLGNLTIAGGSAGATGAVSVAGTYSQTGGSWQQIQTTLPAFSAGQFNFNGGTFLRATGGDGTAGTPYLIADLYGLQGMASTDYLDQVFKLVDDIDASDTENWNAGEGFRPIGDGMNPFYGKFDGDGKTITGLYINRDSQSSLGLFGYAGIGAEIDNVGLIQASVSGDSYVGGLVGVNSGTVSHSYASGEITGIVDIGGLVGQNWGGTVTNSFATASVSGNFNTGGLVGHGLGGSVTNSYATGSVSGNDTTGGLVGLNSNGTVTNSYATGSVSGNTLTGGLIGNGTGSVDDSFWDINTSGQLASAGGTGKTTAEMQTAATFTSAGWDTGVWNLQDGAYPTLKGFGLPTCAFGVCWDGGANTFNWFDAANWSSDLLPTLTQSIYIGALGSPVLFSGTGAFASLTSDADLTMTSGSLTFTDAVNFASGTLFTLQAGTLAFNGLTALDDLTIAGGSAGGTGAVTVAGAFSQTGGSWQQVQTTLPGFSAGQFNFNGGTFLRATGGTGSAGTPYLINDVYGLQGMASTSLLAKQFRLAGDIDASDTEFWNSGAGFRPIGNSANKFTGGLDGGNHAISHLTIQRSTQDYVGLFGYANNASIQNIELVDVAIRGRDYVGGLSGIFSGTISDAAVSGTVAGRNLVAGIAGSLSASTITGSHSSADVSGGENIAGIAAAVSGGSISRSYNLGNVSIDGSGSGVHTGGIAADCFSGCLIEQTYNAGAVSGRFNTGGIAGKLYDGDIRNSFNIGAVENNTTPGNANVGGLAGFIDAGSTIVTSYSTGSVTGPVSAGGLVGGVSGSFVTDSFWDTETSGQALTAGGGTGKTTAEMKTAATFSAAGWDTSTIWTLSDRAYPVLQGLPSPFGPGDEVTPTPEVEPKRVVDNVANFVFSSLRSDPETESDGDGNLTGSPFSLVQVTLAGPDAIEQVVTLEVPKGKVMQCQ